MVNRKANLKTRAVEFVLKLIALSSVCACAKAQKHHNVIYNTAPLIFRPYDESPRWRNFNAQPLRVPFNAAYYGTPPPHAHAHANSQFHSASPNRFIAAPYQRAARYGPNHMAATILPPQPQPPPPELLEQINQVAQQQLNERFQHPRQHETTHLDQRRRIAPLIVQQQRNEGNFHRDLTTNVTNSGTAQRKHAEEYEIPIVRSSGNNGNTGYASFQHEIVHVTTERRAPLEEQEQEQEQEQESRKRRSFPFGKFQLNPQTNRTTKANKMRKSKDNDGTQIDNNGDGDDDDEVRMLLLSTPLDEDHNQETSRKTQKFHDIFMHYADPQSIAYGHVERQPLQFAKRFESVNKGNRYRGEVTWADMKTGGYGTQHWDLAQGAL